MAEETLLSMYLIKYTLRQQKENKIEKILYDVFPSVK